MGNPILTSIPHSLLQSSISSMHFLFMTYIWSKHRLERIWGVFFLGRYRDGGKQKFDEKHTPRKEGNERNGKYSCRKTVSTGKPFWIEMRTGVLLWRLLLVRETDLEFASLTRAGSCIVGPTRKFPGKYLE